MVWVSHKLFSYSILTCFFLFLKRKRSIIFALIYPLFSSFHSHGSKEEDNSLVSIDSEILVWSSLILIVYFMNIEKNIVLCVCLFYNWILIVIPLYVLSFSQIVLIFHSHMFSFAFKKKQIYHFCSYFSYVLFHTRGKKKKKVILWSQLIVKY